MAERKKAGPAKGEVVEKREVTYLPAGVGVSPERGEPTLDPELAKVRDEEIKRNEQVPARATLGEPTIAPELVKAREAELKRDAKRAGVNLADTSVGKSEATPSADAEPATKAPAKKAASSKSSK